MITQYFSDLHPAVKNVLANAFPGHTVASPILTMSQGTRHLVLMHQSEDAMTYTVRRNN